MKTFSIKRFNTILLLVSLLLCGSFAGAQQQQALSQYHLNDLVFNPAVAGTKGYTSFQSAWRKQWTGVEGAPETIMAYLQGPVHMGAGNIGLGAVIYSDKAAAIKRTGVSATYAQHWMMNETTGFSLGLTGTAEQYSLDRQILLSSLDAGDPLLSKSTSGKMAFDAGFSAYVFGEGWSVGAFADNLLQSKISFYNDSQAKLYRHYYLMAQYEFGLNEDRSLTVLPALLAKTSANTPVQLNMNVNLVHQNDKWIGLSYRTNETHSLSANVGLLIDQKLVIGYSYDMVSGKQNQFNAGQNSSHEVTLGFRFLKNDNGDLRQVRCPLL